MEPQTILGVGKVTPLGIAPLDKEQARKQKDELTGMPYYNMVNVRPWSAHYLACSLTRLSVVHIPIPTHIHFSVFRRQVGSIQVIRESLAHEEKIVIIYLDSNAE